MKMQVTIAGCDYLVDLNDPIDISVPLQFNGAQPNTYDVPPARAAAYEDGSFVGDTRRGGSCNFEEYRLIPHCNGTHTECVGHITHERISVTSVHIAAFLPATLITVTPVPAEETPDNYRPEKAEADMLITRSHLAEALKQHDSAFMKALVIRTIPNDASKKSRRYLKQPPPFFTVEAMSYLSELQIEHLLVDIPSVDRTFDNGYLTAHHIFWNMPERTHELNPSALSLRTITEMVYIAEGVSDDRYLLNLQMPHFVADAAPCRPILHRISPSSP